MTRQIALVGLLLAGPSGCQFEPRGSAPPADDPGAGSGPDGGAGSIGGDTAEMILAGPGQYHYDTSSGLLTGVDGQPIEHASEVVEGTRVLSTGSLLLAAGAVLRVEGSLPLRVDAASTIELAGVLDAASSAEGDGAGAVPGDGLAGSSGGAIALIARARLQVSGRILVGGAGGVGGALSGTGGGGGRGGTASLEAQRIVLADGAVVNANGG
ncbi:MAG TPA: hypothetical protein VFU21_17925, partial [Kofleriaceae bacterium]|nr:hypothetical protein [Kofleriaceae bacterium]